MAASSRFRLPPHPVALFVVCLAVVTPAEAQQIAYTATGVVETHGRIDLRTGVDTPLADSPIGVYSSDGQFGLRQEGALLRVWHVPTGAVTTVATDFLPRFAHPREAVLFGVSQGRPARLDAGGVHVWSVCAPVAPNTPILMDVSGDGRTLVQRCGADLVSIDTATGLETHRLTNAGVSGPFAVNHDGTEVTAWLAPALPPLSLVRLRLADGQVLAQSAVNPAASGAGVRSTPDRSRVVASSCQIVGLNIVCSAVLTRAADLSGVQVLGDSNLGPPGVTVSPDGHDAFVSGSGNAGSSAYTDWLDVDTGAVRATVSSPPGPSFTMVYLPSPLPAVVAPAAVVGSSVTLTWSLTDASPQASNYRIEAGYAPGATALSIDLGAATSVTIPGVPRGRYYVRLRAVNYSGVSAPSNEVVIDVP